METRPYRKKGKNMDLTEKTIKSNVIFEGKVLTLCHDDVLLPNGSTGKREIVKHRGGVCIAPLTENNELIFVRQYRYAYGEVVLELPAGKLEKGEEPLESGKRELKEETGCTADKYTFLGKLYPSPGYTGEVISIYLAECLHSGEQSLDEDEFLRVEKIPLGKALEMVMNNEIYDSKTQVAVLKIANIAENRK